MLLPFRLVPFLKILAKLLKMRSSLASLAVAAIAAEVAYAAPQYSGHTKLEPANKVDDYYISFGPRPFYLIDNMTDSALKTKLQSCENGPFKITDASIGHRGGATLQIPEESVENAMAGARFGAGILECDTSLTADKGLVCRYVSLGLSTVLRTSTKLAPVIPYVICTLPRTSCSTRHLQRSVPCHSHQPMQLPLRMLYAARRTLPWRST